MQYVVLVLVIWNAIVFCIYGSDKRRAKRGQRRISEKTLLLSATFMGGFGALAGMHTFRHKTKHLKFMLGVPLLVIVNIAVIYGSFVLLK